MGRNLNLDEDITILLFGSGAGMVWGMASLFIGFSQAYVSSSGSVRAILSLIALPYFAAMWLGTQFELSITDPTGLIIATGALGGFAFTLGLLVLFYMLERIRDRWKSYSPEDPLL